MSRLVWYTDKDGQKLKAEILLKDSFRGEYIIRLIDSETELRVGIDEVDYSL